MYVYRSVTVSYGHLSRDLEIVSGAISMASSSIYHTSQNFRDRKIVRIAGKKGGRNIHDKNIREGSSDTLCNTVTWLILSSVRLIGSLTVDESFSVLYAVACL